jgi:NAD kinase
MFEKVLIVYSEKESETHWEIVDKIRNIVLSEKKLANIVKANDLQQNLFQNIDLVITIGGDGTFIRAASFLKDTKILGINSEPSSSEGALASLKENELAKLKEILKGKFSIIKRKRIQVKRNGIFLDKLALNDIFLGSKNQFHTSRYEISFHEQKEEHRSSGVLVASGSGSHAWYKSAGGKPFNFDEEKMCFMVREPYSGRLFNPELIHGCINKYESIEIISKMHSYGAIALDSDSIYEFNFGDKAEVSLSTNDLNVLVP